MVLSVVAMSAAFAAPAAAATTDRTPTDVTVNPGDTVDVSLDITADSGDGLEVVSEQFDSDLDISTSNSAESQVLTDSQNGTWEVLYFQPVDSDVIDVTYEVPSDATPGTTYTLAGDVVTSNDQFSTGTTTITVAEPEPGPFTVSSLSPAVTTADPGEALTVTADITNEGDASGETTVRVLIDGTEQENTSRPLSEGETASVSFDITAPTTTGVYTHRIETDDDAVTGTLNVGESEFTLDNLTPETATTPQGTALSVSATATNVGDLAAEQTVELEINGTVVATRNVGLAAGDSDVVAFDSVDTSGLEPGEYEHAIVSENNRIGGTLTIEPSVVTYQDDAGNVQTDGLRSAINDWRNDDIDTDLLRAVINAWR